MTTTLVNFYPYLRILHQAWNNFWNKLVGKLKWQEVLCKYDLPFGWKQFLIFHIIFHSITDVLGFAVYILSPSLRVFCHWIYYTSWISNQMYYLEIQFSLFTLLLYSGMSTYSYTFDTYTFKITIYKGLSVLYQKNLHFWKWPSRQIMETI